MTKVFLTLLFLSVTSVKTASAVENLRIAISQFPSSFHPMFDGMVAQSYILNTAIRPVTAHDARWQLYCVLCTDLPSYENGHAKVEKTPDGKEGIAATYTLRPDIFWGDGVPVTTRDIVFSWEMAKHPLSGVANAELFAKDIADIEIVDDKTFIIHFSKVTCEFAAINDFYPLPAHLEKEIFNKDPATYKEHTRYVSDTANPGLYLGPYRISKVDQGASVTLEKNPQWRGRAPAFDEITVKSIENTASLTSNLLSGDIDYIAGELGLLLDQALAFEKKLAASRPGEYKVIYKPGLTYEHIDLNFDTDTFKDLRVRQALLHGINRSSINEQVYAGKQPVAKTDVNPLDSVYTAEVATYPHDPEKAAALMDDAGWKKKEDGFRYDAAGKKLSIVFMTTAGNSSREMIQQAIAADWKKLGVDVIVKNEPARVLFGDTMQQRKFTGGVMFAWMSAPKNIPKTTLSSKMIPAAANNYAGQNFAGYNNPAMDKIIDDLEVVCVADANKKLWEDLQKLYAADLPALPLYYRVDSYFVPKWLVGIEPTGHMNPTTLQIENWSVER